ncbi:MAG: VWA domain-containing protein [Gammaproteobacteria bacterium]|nr:VWA domain-containing protein [Gammaproteobacteria bacterium]
MSCLLSVRIANAAEKTSDIRVLIDVSGSMKKHDPHNLRQPALKLLSSLLPDNTLSGVWLFAEGVTPLIPVGKVNDEWKKSATEQAKKIHSGGLFTHIEAALTAATSDWKEKDDERLRSVIMLTDGVVDISKNKAENQASKERVLNTLLPQLRDTNIKLHTIALSESADKTLLQRLSQATDGWFEIANSADELQRIFLHMFEKSVQLDTLPISDNRFTVDSSVNEMTILLFHLERAAPIHLVDPSEQILSAQRLSENIRWSQNSTYDIITIDQPPPGLWQIKGPADPDNKVMIVTDLRVNLGDLPNYVLPGQTFRFTAEITDQGERIVQENFLQLVMMELQHAAEPNQVHSVLLNDEGSEQDDIAGDGLFSAIISATEASGKHKLMLEVSGETFQRAVEHTFQVRWPVTVDLTVLDKEAGAYTLSITPKTDQIRPESLRVSGKLHPPVSRSSRLTFHPNETGSLIASIENATEAGKHAIEIALHADSIDGEPLRMSLPPITFGETIENPLSPKFDNVATASNDVNWLFIGGIAGGVNVLLGGIGFIGWRVWRQKKQRANATKDIQENQKTEGKRSADKDAQNDLLDEVTNEPAIETSTNMVEENTELPEGDSKSINDVDIDQLLEEEKKNEEP